MPNQLSMPASSPEHATAKAAPAGRRLTLLSTRLGTGTRLQALAHVVVLALLASTVVSLVVLFGVHGWDYYRTPLASRGYSPYHQLLKPSGSIGELLGILGVVLMVAMQLYSVRKRWKRLARFGSTQRWLEFHIFCGIVGPVLVTFHSSFKFNGLIGVGYFSMLVVVLSGFVGRYLYVRIPKTIRGRELSSAELETRAAELKQDLVDTSPPADLLARVEAFEALALPEHDAQPSWGALLFGELKLRLRLWRLEREIRASGFNPEKLHGTVRLIAERAIVLLRVAHLRKTRRIFELWHVYHRPFAYVLLLLLLIHVGVGLYLGYVSVRL